MTESNEITLNMKKMISKTTATKKKLKLLKEKQLKNQDNLRRFQENQYHEESNPLL